MNGDFVDDDAAQRGSDELRALWNALPAPRAGVDADGLPSEVLADSDSATRAAVERLRTAWGAHAVEVPEMPFELRRVHAERSAREVQRSRRTRTTFALRVFVFAGVAAAALAVLALRTERRTGVVERTSDGAVASEDTRPGVGGAAPRAVEPSPVLEESVATLIDIPREDFRLRADGFEFETQGVRFVLIENTGEARSSASETKNY